MSNQRNQRNLQSAIEVAVFDGGELVTTRRCRGLTEARTLMRQVGDVAGFDCLIVSPRLRDSLLSAPRTSVA